MEEVAGCGIATVPIALAPIVAQRFGFAVSVSAFLSFAFPFAFPTLGWCSVLLPGPFRSIFVNLSVFALAGWISRAVPSDSTTETTHLTSTRLGVAIHDGEARVTLLAAFLIHLISSPLC